MKLSQFALCLIASTTELHAGLFARPPFVEASSKRSLEDVLPRLDSYLREQESKDVFSGSVLIAQKGRVVFEQSYGLANRITGDRNTPDTRFNLASVDKFITRIAIFQLLGAGKLHLSGRVGEFIPDYPNADVREKVTVQHLLDMTSGIPSYWNEEYHAGRQSLRTTDDFLALFAHEPLRFEPGRFTEYSNGGFVVLGKIVEKISGTSYQEYVAKHITGPAGMSLTSLDALPLDARGYAIGYTRGRMGPARADHEPLLPNTNRLPGWGSPAGGGYSTVRDFAKLDAALRAGKLLTTDASRQFFGEDFLNGQGAAAGWNGGTPGANTIFAMLPDGTTIIIFANRDPDAAEAIRDKLYEIWGRPQPPAQRLPAPTLPLQLPSGARMIG